MWIPYLVFSSVDYVNYAKQNIKRKWKQRENKQNDHWGENIKSEDYFLTKKESDVLCRRVFCITFGSEQHAKNNIFMAEYLQWRKPKKRKALETPNSIKKIYSTRFALFLECNLVRMDIPKYLTSLMACTGVLICIPTTDLFTDYYLFLFVVLTRKRG